MSEVFGTHHHISTPHTVCGVVNGGLCRTESVPTLVAVVSFSADPFRSIAHQVVVELVIGWLLTGNRNVVFVKVHVVIVPDFGRRAATIVTQRAETRDLGAGLGRTAYAVR